MRAAACVVIWFLDMSLVGFVAGGIAGDVIQYQTPTPFVGQFPANQDISACA